MLQFGHAWTTHSQEITCTDRRGKNTELINRNKMPEKNMILIKPNHTGVLVHNRWRRLTVLSNCAQQLCSASLGDETANGAASGDRDGGALPSSSVCDGRAWRPWRCWRAWARCCWWSGAAGPRRGGRWRWGARPGPSPAAAAAPPYAWWGGTAASPGSLRSSGSSARPGAGEGGARSSNTPVINQ